MNKVYLISYDLKEAVNGRNYGPLLEAIRRSPKYLHPLESTWLIVTAETPKQIWNRLAEHIAKNDRMFIVELNNSYTGWLTKSTWAWLAENLPK